ncbi:hypothetical protein EVA_07762 [gut metagenome]|uniref:Uncharacterized protein n=1 Tax=gut metagenome TaxID=749906 RepID=J9GBB2_9ZZZZ
MNSIFPSRRDTEELPSILYSLAQEVRANKDTIEKNNLFMFVYNSLRFRRQRYNLSRNRKSILSKFKTKLRIITYILRVKSPSTCIFRRFFLFLPRDYEK